MCENKRHWRLFFKWHLLTDERSRTAIEVAERYAFGEATRDALNAAAQAAGEALLNEYLAAQREAKAAQAE